MKQSIVILPYAEQDLLDIYNWYEKQKEGLGDEFMTELDEYLASISLNPFLFPVKHHNYHCCFFKRFPYCLYYYPTDRGVLVWALLHTSKDASKAVYGRGIED